MSVKQILACGSSSIPYYNIVSNAYVCREFRSVCVPVVVGMVISSWSLAAAFDDILTGNGKWNEFHYAISYGIKIKITL